MKKVSVGGQALIEGLLMIGPENAAIAVRKPDGGIVVETQPVPPGNLASKIPVIRGIRAFFRQMVLGIKALMYSAEFVDLEIDEEPSRLDKFIDKIFGDKFKDAAVYFTVIVSLAFSVGLFILLPNILAGLLQFDRSSPKGVILYNVFEGLVRIVLFFGYLVAVSRMKDIQRVWQYHGAEHKTIHAYENGEKLTVENIRKYPIRHPRCGTSFLFLVMIISIFTFSFIGWYGPVVNLLLRLALIPLIAGVSYEILKIAGRCEGKAMKIINAPGLAFQYLTTREPDDSMIEVAIAAMNNITIPENPDKGKPDLENMDKESPEQENMDPESPKPENTNLESPEPENTDLERPKPENTDLESPEK